MLHHLKMQKSDLTPMLHKGSAPEVGALLFWSVGGRYLLRYASNSSSVMNGLPQTFWLMPFWSR